MCSGVHSGLFWGFISAPEHHAQRPVQKTFVQWNRKSYHLDHPKLKSGNFISPSGGHRLTRLKINQRSINNIDSYVQRQQHKLGQRHSVSSWTSWNYRKEKEKPVRANKLSKGNTVTSPFPSKSFANKVLSSKHTCLLHIPPRDGCFCSLRGGIPKLGNGNMSHFHWDP